MLQGIRSVDYWRFNHRGNLSLRTHIVRAFRQIMNIDGGVILISLDPRLFGDKPIPLIRPILLIVYKLLLFDTLNPGYLLLYIWPQIHILLIEFVEHFTIKPLFVISMVHSLRDVLLKQVTGVILLLPDFVNPWANILVFFELPTIILLLLLQRVMLV